MDRRRKWRKERGKRGRKWIDGCVDNEWTDDGGMDEWMDGGLMSKWLD